MRIHRNAKTTLATRQLLIQRVSHGGWTLSEASAAMASVARPGTSGYGDTVPAVLRRWRIGARSRTGNPTRRRR